MSDEQKTSREEKIQAVLSQVDAVRNKTQDLLNSEKSKKTISVLASLSNWLRSGSIFAWLLGVVVYFGGLAVMLWAFSMLFGQGFDVLKHIEDNMAAAPVFTVALVLMVPCLLLAFGHWFYQGGKIVRRREEEVRILPRVLDLIQTLCESLFILAVTAGVTVLIISLLEPEFGRIFGFGGYSEITRGDVWAGVFKFIGLALMLLLSSRLVNEFFDVFPKMLRSLEDIRHNR